MKNFIVSFFCLLSFCLINAKTDCDISLGVQFGDKSPEMTQQNMTYLKNVINKALTQGNKVGSIDDAQFGIVVYSDIVNEHIIAGAPTKTVLNLNITLYVGNIIDGKVLSSQSFDVNGVGNSKGKAFNNAIHKINSQNTTLVSFAAKAKEEIVSYYDRNMSNIIKEAKALASLRNYEEAIFRLMSIPSCCNGYDNAMNEVKIIYKQFIDQQCHENLAQAQAAWMSGFNKQNAAVAGVFLSEIYPDAECYDDALELANEIKNHMGEEWKFEMKRWNDMVSVESQRLKYAREIALAFAQNQPQQVIHLLY